MIAFPDNIVTGIALLPQRLRQEATEDWLGIYLGRLNDLQDSLVTYFNWLLTWDQPGAPTPDFVLRNIGKMLGQPWPDNATKEEYRRILTVRRFVRLSSGTRPQVREIVKAIGDVGGGAQVHFLPPHGAIVVFANFAAVAAEGFTQDVVSSILLDSIGACDRLQIWDAVGNVFSWDVQNQGWLQAVWATKLFDSQDL